MAIGETIPTIAELKGNTILELFKNGYNALKNALTGKQNKLVAGSNIVIDETTNRISAIEGGSATLEDYYTKEEVNEIASELSGDINDKADADDVYDKTYIDTALSSKADSDDVYNKSEVDTLVANAGDVVVILPTISKTSAQNYINIDTELKEGDILSCCLRNGQNKLLHTCTLVYGAYNEETNPKATVTGFDFISSSKISYYSTYMWGFTEGNHYARIYNVEGYVTFTNGSGSATLGGIYSTEQYISEIYSTIKIYRKKEVTQ